MIKFESLSKNYTSDFQKTTTEFFSTDEKKINSAKKFADGLFEKSLEELHSDAGNT